MTGIMMDSTVVAVKDQMSCDLVGEAIILSIKTGIYYTLDPVGSRIWSLIQEPVKLRKVRDIIIREYDVDMSKCEEDLILLFSELEKEGLIAIESPNVH
jgi:hypothetical protein